MYVICSVLYFAMTGERLIRADSRSGMIRQQREAKSVRLEQIPESWPPRLRDIVIQCLQADPRDRYQTADSLVIDLMRALVPDESDGTVSLGSGSMEQAQIVSPVLSWIALGVLLVLVAAVAILHWYNWIKL